MALSEDAIALMNKINKQFGPGSVMVASDIRSAGQLPSSITSLDLILGGGFPRNQWSEVIGMEGSGKTTVCHKTVAHNQNQSPDFTTLWIAAEAYDVEQAAMLGVDVDRVIVHATNRMEEAFQVAIDAAEARTVDLIILDSYPALVPDGEAEKDMDEASMTLGARLFGKFFRKIGKETGRSMAANDRPVTGIIINQWREKVGGFSPAGTPKTTPGGLAKNFAYYCRLEVARAEWLDEARPGKGKARVGQVMKFKTLKNKQIAGQKSSQSDYYFEDAPNLGFRAGEFDAFKDVFLWAIHYDVIERRGAYYNFGETRWKGKDEALAAIREDVDLMHSLTEEVMRAADPRQHQEAA
ncbi:ATPase domain-containing protein [Streptomyces sp. WZ-12]|uniref:ATPase domain-containing protein n=1 Tax=Streptomyces sp. WZ-12 TaxID=3030210 RepID=UPI0023810B5E|nr:ATPase domain-containing protein [Streptomyces sp. WZ-12]